MTSKPNPLAFQPAPRPASRVYADMAERLADATADLGFLRSSSSPSAAELKAPAPAGPSPRAPSAGPEGEERARSATAKPKLPAPAPGAPGSASLKFDLPEDLWTELKIQAARRRVTVKFLVLEALSKQGYSVDLDAIPEDGRRLR